jgi:hypothetical protein
MYGCRQAFPTEKTVDPDAMLHSQHAVWETERTTCPVCREAISQTVRACPFCKTPVQFQGGRTVANLYGPAPSQPLRTASIVVFIASFVACFAPIVVIVSGILLWKKGKELARIGQIFRIITMLSLVISSIFCLLMLIFWLSGG